MNPDPLAELRGLALPEEISWWPPAPGWWFLTLLAIVVLFSSVRYLLIRRRKNRWRKSALSQLREIRMLQKNPERNEESLLAISRLFRRVALKIENRENIARLNGEAWLEKLDNLTGETVFTKGYGRCLADDLWQRQQTGEPQQLSSLLDLLEKFIRKAG